MNDRERFLATMHFEKPDRILFSPGGGRRSTVAAWRKQGLPADVQDYHAYVRQLLGIANDGAVQPHVYPEVDFRMIPHFEEKVLEHRPSQRPGVPGVLVVQDWKGNVCEISDEFDVSFLRDAVDFVTRSWLKCPVESRADWPDMARRYDPLDPKRFPADFARRVKALNARDYHCCIGFPGPFWQLREWLGFENLCMLLLDDPDFAREMIAFWQDFVSRLLLRTFEQFVPDSILVSEDMAYKEKPMIGPEMCREFLLPCWRTWAEICKGAGVSVYEIDSDGHVGELIPTWIEAGFICNSPQEVAAGNDLPAYRQLYGKKMAYTGGVDKRAIAKGGQVIRAEMARLKPVIDAGGYIPGCDHGVPADVSWPNYVEYSRLLAQATGWL